MPGDPAYAFLPQNFTMEQYHVIRRWLGLDDPMIVQYFRYIGDLFTGDWGVSLRVSNGQPVWELIWERFPRTMELSLFSMLIAAFVGVRSGVISARHKNKAKDTIIRGISLVGVSMPIFWMGTLLQFFLTYQIDLFPAVGFKTAWYPDPPQITGFRIIDSLISGKFYLTIDTLIHLILPVACLSFISLASITRQTRSSMLEVLELDYVRTARAKGAKEKDVIKKHALKNALIPTATVIGLNFGGLLSGAILTETTFSLHGMGELLINAIVRYDYFVLNASVFLIALTFVIINLFMDVIYGFLDPRIRY
jgi:peptide/nickel transport system permease protein